MQLLGLLSVACMQGSLMAFAPLILHGLITLAKISQNPQGVTSPVSMAVNLGVIKNQLAKVTANEAKLKEMKYDIEAYLGFYLIVMLVFGSGNLLSIMLYWQLMRVRYMVSYGVQGAWTRVDARIKNSILGHPRCPGVVRTVYYKVRNFAASMIPDPQAEAARQQNNGGGITGAL